MDETRVITMNVGTAAQWDNQVRPLEAGEFGYATDTDELKIGDGVSPWSELSSRKGYITLTQEQFDALPVKNPLALYLVEGE